MTRWRIIAAFLLLAGAVVAVLLFASSKAPGATFNDAARTDLENGGGAGASEPDIHWNMQTNFAQPEVVPHREGPSVVDRDPWNSPPIGLMRPAGMFPPPPFEEHQGRSVPTRILYYPRAADEWQGMRMMNLGDKKCSQSSTCNMAMACVDGICSICSNSEDCASGEVCVIDHCLLAYKADCKSRRDCSDGQLCKMTAYTSSGRANEEMRSYCN